ncbi:AzlC family ABC transporter permease [Nocardia sp. NPDC059228]|uniref:AzlC family ABC transporter permease n=1 Tax=Nocardia sp. NPDC059228 TaxID=3346777 RepID=UPI0036D15608
MRSAWRTLDRGVLTGIAAICLAVALIGVSYGATAVTSGLPGWLPVLMSVAVVAGGSEFVFIGILTAGGGLIAAVLAGLLVNARHLPYGLSVPDVVGTGWRRLLGTHVMNDESVAMALAQPDRDRRHAAYWVCGLSVVAAWPMGAAIGAVLGAVVPDPNAFGLDAVFPAVLFSLVLPALREPLTRTAALAGAVVAAATTPFLGAGLPVLLALTAVLLVVRRAGKPDAETTGDPATPTRGPVTGVSGTAQYAGSHAAGTETITATAGPV